MPNAHQLPYSENTIVTRKTHVLFDLDGTLTDPKGGITKSVAYALKRTLDIDVDPDTLTPFIGPPLKESFMTFYHMDEANALKAVLAYRECFEREGLYDNIKYEGIETVLEALKLQGATLAVATSKPTEFAIKILEHFELEHFFTHIVGSCLDGSRSHKHEVVAFTLKVLENPPSDAVIMVGDRLHDVEGAKRHGIDCIGVAYGYAALGELEAAGAIAVVETVSELKALLMDMVN